MEMQPGESEHTVGRFLAFPGHAQDSNEAWQTRGVADFSPRYSAVTADLWLGKSGVGFQKPEIQASYSFQCKFL